MQRRGLVERSGWREDGRGAWVVLTEQGRSAIERAAPGHATTVGRLIFDDLTPHELQLMAGVIDKVLGRLTTDTGPNPGSPREPMRSSG